MLSKFSVALAVLFLAVLPFYPLASATLTVSHVDTGFGFQNGSYLYFRDSIVFVTAVDGGGTQQEESSNASYPSFMFLQEQGSTAVYGFWFSGCNVTVNSFFDNNLLEFAADGAGTLKVQTAALGAPTLVSGATGLFDQTLGIATLTISGVVTGQLNFNPVGAGPGSLPDANSDSGSNPTPQPSSPLGSNDFRVNDLDLAGVALETVVSADLTFDYTGSTYSLENLTFSEPFQSWVNPSSFQKLTYILSSNSVSHGVLPLQFRVPNGTDFGEYVGDISLTAKDSFGGIHTSTAKIHAVVGGETTFNFGAWIRENPLVVAALIGAVVVVLALAARTRRR